MSLVQHAVVEEKLHMILADFNISVMLMKKKTWENSKWCHPRNSEIKSGCNRGHRWTDCTSNTGVSGGKWQVGAVTNPTADGRGFEFSTAATSEPSSHSFLCRLPVPRPLCLCRNNRTTTTKKMTSSLDWPETRKRRRWRRKRSSGSCSTPSIMTSRRTRQANKLLERLI